MTTQTIETMQKQIEALVLEPVRAYAALTLDHAARLAATQIDAYQAYAQAGLEQARGLAQVTDADGFTTYLQKQQQAAQQIGERMQGDAGKLVAMNQAFVGKSQELAEKSVRKMSRAAVEAAV